MLKKIFLLFYFCFLVFITNKSLSEEFFFEGEEIQILNNGQKLKSNNGIKINSTNGIVITAQEFEYDKINSELIVNKDVLVNDIINNTTIKTNKIKYFKNLEKILTYGKTDIEIEKKIFLKTRNLIYLRNDQKIKSTYKTSVNDNFNNKFITEGFLFNLSDKILKGENVIVNDVNNNVYFFVFFFLILSSSTLFNSLQPNLWKTKKNSELKTKIS